MEAGEHSLALLGAVLLIGLVSPEVLKRFQLPFATALIIVGAAVGPHGAGAVAPNATLTLFAFLGATFQMFLAGLEAHALEVRFFDRDNVVVCLFDGVVPAAAGGAIALGFGYDWEQAAFIAAVFASSSILLVFAMVQHYGLDGAPVGHRAKAVAIVLDVAASLAVFVLLKHIDPHERFPLPILLGLLVVSVAALRMYVPEIAEFAFARLEREPSTGRERKLRFSLALMLLIVFAYEALDVPAFIGAFLAGFALAPVRHAPELRDKLHLIGNALFIPVFLFAVGLETDLATLIRWDPANLVVTVLVVAAIVPKLAGGFAGGRLVGMPARDAAFLGIVSTARLAVPIAATYAGFKAGLLDAPLLTAVVVGSVATSLFAPLALSAAGRRRIVPERD